MGYRFLGDYEPQKGKKKNGAQTAPRSGNSANPFAANQKKPSAQATGAAQTAQSVRTSRGTALGGSAVTPVQMLKPTAPKLTKVSTPVQKTTQVQGQQLKLPNIQAFGAGDYSRAGKTLDRAAKTVKAGALNSAAGFTEIAAQFHPTTGEQSMGQFSGFGDLGRAVRENREKGTDINASIRQQEEQRRAQRKQSQQKMFAAADRLTEKGQQYEQEAKQGLGTVGQFLVDMGVTGTQMAGDAIANLVLPGSGLAMMGMRSYGQAAGEARKAGKSEQQQFLAGLKNAGIEVFTEKMFGAFSKVYGGAAADELIEKLVGKMTGNVTGQALLTWMINGVGEGVEEVTSDLLNPLADRLLGLDDGTGPIWSVDDLAQWGYDFLLGTAMGIVGGGTQLARGVQQGRAQTAESRYYDDLLRNGLGSAAAAENARRASAAMGRVMPARDGLRMPQLTTYEQRQAANQQTEMNTPFRQPSRLNNENGLAAYTPQERVNLSSGVRNKIISTYQDAVEFIKNALANKNSVDRAYMGVVPENVAQRVAAETGIDISGFGVMMNGNDVRHILKRHGDSAAEALQGQVAVTEDDVAQIPQVIAHPDDVYLSADGDGKGRQAIVFEKQLGDTYITIQGVANGKKLLQADTLYIRKRRTRKSQDTMPDAVESAAPVINVRDELPLSSSFANTSVPQSGTGVNTQGMQNGGEYAANRLRMPQLVDEQGRTYEERMAWQQIPETQRAAFDDAQRIAQRFGARVVVSQQEGVNGSYRDGVISLNPNAVNPVRQTLIHELTHHMERSGLYGEFRDMALRYVAENMGADVDSVRQAVIADYARNGVALDEDGATREIVAKFAEEKLFTDETTVRRLLAEDRNLFQRIYDWIRDMAGRLTGTSEESFLRSAEKLYAKALRETTAETGRGTQMLFAGENARTANMQTLNRAQALEASGAAAEDIRRETGWFRGMDGKWRFEIDDSAMRYDRQGVTQNPDVQRKRQLEEKLLYGQLTQEETNELRALTEMTQGIPGPRTLSDYIQHDALFEAYPELRDAAVVFEETEPGVNGYYNAGQNTIVLDSKLRGAPESTLVHEIQHAVQRAEGFARGSTPEYWKYKNKDGQAYRTDRQYMEAEKRGRDAFDAMPDSVQDEVRRINRAKSDQDWDEVLRLEDDIYNGPYAELYSAYDLAEFDRRSRVDYYKGANYVDLYTNTAGEIEARDAANRRSYSAEQRRLRMPNLGNANTVFAGGNGTAYDINPFRRKAAQLSAIQQSNPFDPSLGAHTWIRSEGDILTYQEAIDNFGGVDDVTPDFRAQDVQAALDSGYMTVYSSYPIEQGTFVTPSRMEAQSYAGEGRVYSKQVPLSDVAWLDEVQGQYTGPVGQVQYSTGRGLDDLAGSSDYLDALARDENMFTSDAYTLADRLYDLQLRRVQQQEAPPERPAEQVAREDLDEIAELFTDQGNFFASREDRIRETENMVTDHTIEVGKSGKEKATEAWSYFYRKMVDAGHSVDKFAKAAGDPYLYQIYNQARASSSAGVSMITDAQTNVNAQKVGESLNGVFSPIRAKGEDYYRAFQLYMFDLHNIDRMSLSQNKEAAVLEATAALNEFDANHPEMRTSTEAQLARMTESLDPDVAELARERMQLLRNINKADAIKDKPVFSFDVTADVSQERARRAAQEHPEFEQYRQQVRTYIDNLMQYRVDSGLMTQADADYLKRLYPNYVPTMRKGGEQVGTGRDRNAVHVGRTVGRAEGGTADLVPLHEALGRQTMKVVREGSKNRFGQRLLDDFVRVGENSPAARYVQEAHEYEHEFTPDTLDDMSREQLTKDKTLTVFKDGKLWELTVDDTMFDALKALSPDAAESNAVTRTIRTANNLFKALVTGYNPTFTIRNTVRDLQTAGLYTRDAVAFAQNYPKALAEIKNNGEYWQMYKALGGSFSSVFDYNTGTVKEPKGRTAKLMAKIEALNMAMEQAPRLAEFMGVVEKGGTSTENLADALYAAADVTVNFGRSGTLGKVLNANYVPFLNPGIQGFDKLIRRVTETKGGREWAKLAVRAVALGVAPTLLNALLYHDDDEWDDLRDSDKDTNYLFKLGNGTWLKIPKGRELSLLGITADRIGDVIRGDNVDLIATINTMGNQVAPANPLTSNIASALFEAQLFDPSSPGRTWYGGDIENQRLQSYAPGQRYDSSTDIFSKAVGGALGISPKKLNYVLDQYSGVVGDFLLPLLTPQAERGMFSKAFTVDAVTSNRLSGDFYDESDALTYAKNGGDETAAVVSRFWSKQQSACSDLYKQIREVEASNLSDREKRQKTRELKALVNGIQKNAMAVEDTYRAAVEKHLQKGMDTDDAYRAANKDCFGAEYALQVYSKDVYEKAKNAKSNGVSYDDYYTYYFGTKGLKATDDTSVTTQKFAFLQSSGMDITSQAEIYFADMASDKVLQTQAELEISSGITAEQFYQYKVVSSGMTKKAEKMQAINSLNLTSAQKDAIYYAEGWARSTIGQAPWRGGYSSGYTASGTGGNPFTRARTGSNPFLRTSGAANTGGTAQNPFTRARSQNSGQTVQNNPFLRARGNG
nr:MAG TPA: Type I restriction enzyme Methylase [Bacteriophage sp.]